MLGYETTKRYITALVAVEDLEHSASTATGKRRRGEQPSKSPTFVLILIFHLITRRVATGPDASDLPDEMVGAEGDSCRAVAPGEGLERGGEGFIRTGLTEDTLGDHWYREWSR